MNSEVQRKHPHVAGPTVYFAGRFDQSLNAPGIPNGTRSASTRISSMIAVSIDAGRIFHKLRLLEKKNLESDIEFLTASLPLVLSRLVHWLRRKPAKSAPFFTGPNTPSLIIVSKPN